MNLEQLLFIYIVHIILELLFKNNNWIKDVCTDWLIYRYTVIYTAIISMIVAAYGYNVIMYFGITLSAYSFVDTQLTPIFKRTIFKSNQQWVKKNSNDLIISIDQILHILRLILTFHAITWTN